MTKYETLQNKDHIDLILQFSPNEESIGAYIKLGWTFCWKVTMVYKNKQCI